MVYSIPEVDLEYLVVSHWELLAAYSPTVRKPRVTMARLKADAEPGIVDDTICFTSGYGMILLYAAWSTVFWKASRTHLGKNDQSSLVTDNIGCVG